MVKAFISQVSIDTDSIHDSQSVQLLIPTELVSKPWLEYRVESLMR